jgi:hypothetical protein
MAIANIRDFGGDRINGIAKRIPHFSADATKENILPQYMSFAIGTLIPLYWSGPIFDWHKFP